MYNVLSRIYHHNLVLTSFVEFTTASTSRFHGFPLHRYIFELISWSTGNLETIQLLLLSPPDWEVKGSGKYLFENEGSSLSYSKEERWSALLHRGTWSKLTTQSPLSVGDPPRVAVVAVATVRYIFVTLNYSHSPVAKSTTIYTPEVSKFKLQLPHESTMLTQTNHTEFPWNQPCDNHINHISIEIRSWFSTKLHNLSKKWTFI